jgi:hypothetical protein
LDAERDALVARFDALGARVDALRSTSASAAPAAQQPGSSSPAGAQKPVSS